MHYVDPSILETWYAVLVAMLYACITSPAYFGWGLVRYDEPRPPTACKTRTETPYERLIRPFGGLLYLASIVLSTICAFALADGIPWRAMLALLVPYLGLRLAMIRPPFPRHPLTIL